mgnify:CR=1 FL=1
MKLIDVLTPENTVASAEGGSKKRVLENLSVFLTERMEGVNADDLYQSLLARERLGSTGIGEGVAIPHCRLAGCEKITGALVKLADAVDFETFIGDRLASDRNGMPKRHRNTVDKIVEEESAKR